MTNFPRAWFLAARIRGTTLGQADGLSTAHWRRFAGPGRRPSNSNDRRVNRALAWDALTRR